jgi:hypothetical protein
MLEFTGRIVDYKDHFTFELLDNLLFEGGITQVAYAPVTSKAGCGA